MPNGHDVLLTVGQAGKWLGFSPSKTRVLCNAGRLRSERVGVERRIRISELERYQRDREDLLRRLGVKEFAPPEHLARG